VHAGANGTIHTEFFMRGFTLGTVGNPRILDEDGTDVILHSGPDDYTKQPSGNSGDLITSVVLEPVE